ncbi:UNVERIFIED_CONTAM: hypothetical protein K2H54_043793 [Gekko kuhli]
MAPKKGTGKKKGKQPAPKPPPKRPAPTLSSSDEESDGVQQAILERLQAVEQAAGISALAAEQGGRTHGQKETRLAATKRFQAEVLIRLSLVEGRNTAQVQQPSDRCPLHIVARHAPMFAEQRGAMLPCLPLLSRWEL